MDFDIGDKISVNGVVEQVYTNEEEDRNLMVMIEDERGSYTAMLRPQSVEKIQNE